MRRYMIIGAGVAGLTAAEVIRRNDPSGEVTLVNDDPHGHYSRPGLGYYLNRTVPERQLFHRSAREIRELRLNYVYGRADALSLDSHRVILQDGRRLAYDRLLLATGARATPPDFPGSELNGLVKLDTLEDARHILKLVRRARPAVVIGGGITALELVEGLHAHGMCVHYFLRGDRFWAKLLDETESRLVEGRLAAEGIRLHYRTQIARALGKRGNLDAVETQADEVIPCRVLGVAMGVCPKTELAQEAGLATDRGVLVNEYLETSAADVFAAGDVAQVRDSCTGQHVVETLWPTARKHGELAGANMAGTRTAYVRELSFNVARVAGLITSMIGSVECGRDPAVLTVTRGGNASRSADMGEISRVRILVGERAIVGALVMGDQALSRPLEHMIRAQADVSSIRPALLRDPEAGVDLIARFYLEEVAH